MRLSAIFKEIKNSARYYATSSSGEDFENKFIISLRNGGFSRINAGKNFEEAKKEIKKCEKNPIFQDEVYFQNILKNIKNKILAKTSTELVQNPFKQFNDYFIYQPYGSQNFPDFLVFTKKYIIPIEIKFSQNHSGHDTKKLSSRPVWNSNLPKSNAIYLYAISGADTTFFKGSDVIDNDVIKILINYFKNLDKNTDSLNNALSKYENNFGFYPYIRKAYEQKLEKSTYFENGKKAIESYFSSKREQRENNVINFFERIENESDN